MITYSRKFRIQAAHFNDLAYGIREKARQRAAAHELADSALLWQEVARECHGHNFEILVSITGHPISPRENWIIDDVALTKLVMQWDNTNLSMLPEFDQRDLRATTENMAHLLCRRIQRLLRTDDNKGTEPPRVVVQVRETPDIEACAESEKGS